VLDPGLTGIAWAMSASNGLKLDGVAFDRAALMTHGLEAPHRIAQPDALTIGAVFLPAAMADRGWPERRRAARIDRVAPDAMPRLQSTLRDIVRLAAGDPSRFSCENVVAGMQQTLLGQIDHAFATAPGTEGASLAVANYVRICRRAGEFIRAATGPLPTNAEVAAAAGVTVRTLQNAVLAVHGMSLQRLLVLNRLWAVRAALMHSGPDGLVKTIAFDHGFWHLGRFSKSYRAFFGETPSDTLARVTGRRTEPEAGRLH
jgi:AraC family ethanolamine operon transcriptional activator